ncbi:MAG: hypothetical protein ACFE85_03970 [Candidatus Hodarchaeota archaeon]
MNKLKVFNIGKIQFAELLEIHLIRFLNKYIGEIGLVEAIIKNWNPSEVIFFNGSKSLIKVICNLIPDLKVQFFNEKVTRLFDKLLEQRKFLRFILIRIVYSFIKRNSKLYYSKDKKNVMFIANTLNQLRSIKPIYRKLLNSKEINPILYFQSKTLPIVKFGKYYVFLSKILFNWKKNYTKICKDIGIYNELLNLFYERELKVLLTYIFNEYTKLYKSFQEKSLSLITISNQNRAESKLAAKICELRKIPTVYIPHASVPIDKQVYNKKPFSFLALWGEKDIEFYKNHFQMPDKKLILTGNPGFEHFYRKTFKALKEVKDIFSNRVYKFEPGKNTILLATNVFDKASKEKLLITVLNSLKELNLIDNLIIKLHPDEDGKDYKNILNRLNVNPLIVRDYDVLRLIKSSNILISCISSIILEAMIIGTPIILAEFVNLDFLYIIPYGFTNKEFIKVSENHKSLTETIKNLLYNQEIYLQYAKQIQEKSSLFSYYNKNEPPTEKIINLIRKKINII